MILQPEPGSRLVTRTTFAPLARHWSACETCFWASPSAFTTVAAILAFLKAAMNVGRSCVSQRTDDFVSGSRTQAWMSAPVLPLVASAPPAITASASTPTRAAISVFFTWFLLAG